MKNKSIYIIFILILFGSAASQKKADFSGKLLLEIAGESYLYDDMTRTDSRLSFQEKGIVVYIVNPTGDGTIAEITILSTKIYNSKIHNFDLGAKKEKPKTMLDIYKSESGKDNDVLNFKFRRIDKMQAEEYIVLKTGKVNLEYADDPSYFKMSFNGKDRDGTLLSGSLELHNPYLMDSRD
ncbi:hypothetical protein [Marivirga harenae]|uniref:hypothetical protein n=1 Tax=Marivirga harenae TaxID=2010992 RepID=UPI0026DEEAE4|nr:hypothetical protein [Marivirga harenae]WKV13031.1 hypothetical protein Q3Y49_04215 [Marivirga harenae]